jgi:hypothetical protein
MQPALCANRISRSIATSWVEGENLRIVGRQKEAASLPRAQRVLLPMPNTHKVTLRGQPDFITVKPSRKQGWVHDAKECEWK